MATRAMDRNLRTQQELAERVLARFEGRVEYGSVQGAPGLHVTVSIDDVDTAFRALRRFGVSAPITMHAYDMRSYQQSANPRRQKIRRQNGWLDLGPLQSSIHPPPDPSLRVLGREARGFWDGVFEEAQAYYGASGAPKAKETAERTAWRAVRMHWTPSSGSTWTRKKAGAKPKKTRLPDTGDTIILGKLLEYVWINDNGSLDVRRWEHSHPDLHWNEAQKALYVYPNVPDQTVCKPIPADMRSEADLYQTWAQRPAKCAHLFEANVDFLQPMGVGDSVAYRSDKWHEQSLEPDLADSQEYFHQFSDGNMIWQDSDSSPNAIMMAGGKLAVIDRGIIH